MKLEIIETIEAFEAARDDWDRVYMADPEARHFLSWSWLYGFLKRRKRWFVLAIREDGPGSPFIAFFPLRIQTNRDSKGNFHDKIIMAGNYVADYTGYIAMPEFEAEAISIFVGWLKREHWAEFKLDFLCGPLERRDAFIRHLLEPGVVACFKQAQNEQKNDNTICPVIELPDSWDGYLENHMSSQTRQKLRRFLRKVENGGDYRITTTTAETIERDLNILLRFWKERWEAVKGEKKTQQIIFQTHAMLLDSFADGNLDLPVMWCGDRPIGVLANILDRQKKEILFYLTGRDETWKTPSPGLVLHGYCIRKAIAEGFKRYDFLRGNEPYKYMFGVEELQISCTTISTKNGHNRGGNLNRRSIRYVYEHALKFYGDRKLDDAGKAFRQVLKAAPEHLGAEFGIANILFEESRLDDAEAAYHKLMEKGGEKAPLLVKLADIHLTRKQLAKAVSCLREAIRIDPNRVEALYKLGVALIASKNLLEASDVLLKASNVSSNERDQFYARKAKEALLRIPAGIGIKPDNAYYPALAKQQRNKTGIVAGLFS